MSKSVGNILSMREFAEKYHAEIYKFMILSVHYRSVAEFSDEVVHRTISSLAKVYSSLAIADLYKDQAGVAMASAKLTPATDALWNRVMTALSDDFNMAEVMAIVYEVVKTFNQGVKRGLKANPAVLEKCVQFKLFLNKLSKLTSLIGEAATSFLKFLDDKVIQIYNIDLKQVEKLIAERKLARADKNFALSDQLRDQLNQMKIAISDTPDGTYWEVMK